MPFLSVQSLEIFWIEFEERSPHRHAGVGHRVDDACACSY
jgi:hypothetical protein